MKKLNIHRAERRGSARLSRSRSASFASKLLIITVIVLLLSACASVATTPTAIPILVLDNNDSSPNNQADNPDAVTASAIIVPVNDVQLSFPAIGQVTSVDVKVGDKVTAGQTLVTLDTTILEAKVKEAEADVLAADAQIRYLNRLATDPLHYESAQADLARAQALLDSAKATLASQSTLIAPFDGTVVSVDINPAETVVPGQVVIVL